MSADEGLPEDAGRWSEARRIAAERIPGPGVTMRPEVQAMAREGYAAALVWGWRDLEHLARQARLRRGHL